jgi:hypothetical protein
MRIQCRLETGQVDSTHINDGLGKSIGRVVVAFGMFAPPQGVVVRRIDPGRNAVLNLGVIGGGSAEEHAGDGNAGSCELVRQRNVVLQKGEQSVLSFDRGYLDTVCHVFQLNP